MASQLDEPWCGMASWEGEKGIAAPMAPSGRSFLSSRAWKGEPTCHISFVMPDGMWVRWSKREQMALERMGGE